MKSTSIKLLAVCAIIGSTFATQANSLAIKDDKGKSISPAEIKAITITDSTIPELKDLAIPKAEVPAFLALGDTFREKTGRDIAPAVSKYATLEVQTNDGRRLELVGISGGVAQLKEK